MVPIQSPVEQPRVQPLTKAPRIVNEQVKAWSLVSFILAVVFQLAIIVGGLGFAWLSGFCFVAGFALVWFI